MFPVLEVGKLVQGVCSLRFPFFFSFPLLVLSVYGRLSLCRLRALLLCLQPATAALTIVLLIIQQHCLVTFIYLCRWRAAGTVPTTRYEDHDNSGARNKAAPRNFSIRLYSNTQPYQAFVHKGRKRLYIFFTGYTAVLIALSPLRQS